MGPAPPGYLTRYADGRVVGVGLSLTQAEIDAIEIAVICKERFLTFLERFMWLGRDQHVHDTEAIERTIASLDVGPAEGERSPLSVLMNSSFLVNPELVNIDFGADVDFPLTCPVALTVDTARIEVMMTVPRRKHRELTASVTVAADHINDSEPLKHQDNFDGGILDTYRERVLDPGNVEAWHQAFGPVETAQLILDRGPQGWSAWVIRDSLASGS